MVRSASGKFLTPGVGRYTLHLLGTVSLEGPDGPLSGYPVQRRQLALLAILAVSWRDGITRDKVLAHLWPETAPHSARHSLADALYRLRKELGQDVILGRSTNLRLNPDLIHVDLVEFEKAVDTHDLDTAAELGAGPFLDGFHLGGSGEFDVWKDGEARRLAERRDTVLDALARRAEEEGDFARAAHWLRRLLASDPYNSGTVIRLMKVQAVGGDPGNAVKLAAEHAALLVRELAVEPPPELVALAGQLHGKPSGAEVPAHPIPLPFVAPAGAPAAAAAPDFVGRDAELARLHQFLEGALGGNGQVVFITGEAGTGKTALADEFCRRAAESNQDLVVVSGHGNAYTGAGDPYLLFREVLNQLSGDVEDRYAAGSLSQARATRLWNLMPVAAAALFDVGPDLLDTLVSSRGLAARVAGYARAVPEWEPWARRLHERSEQRSAALPPQAMFDQYVRVLKTVARARPVIVLLDDLQWADDGSVSLLFQLARELVGSRILVLGLFRPSDVALGRAGKRHPMDIVVHELQRKAGEIQIRLGENADRGFLDALVDAEPNRLGPEFRDNLFRVTEGDALFTVELLRSMRDDGMLVPDSGGRWIVGPTVNWHQLPARVEAVIAERMARVPEPLLRALSVGSVEGERFTLEAVAEVVGVPVAELLAGVGSELEKRHHLVRAHGIRLVNGRRVSEYRFRHILFQRYLYDGLDEIERALLHEQVGQALEALHGEASDQIALSLARHFEQAGLMGKAATYLFRAGVQATDANAFSQAIDHFESALRALDTLPDSVERAQQELELLLGLGYARHLTAAPGQHETFSTACRLAGQAGSERHWFWALLGLYAVHLWAGDHRSSWDLAKQSLALALKDGDPALIAPAHDAVARTALFRGDPRRAAAHFQAVLTSQYDPRRHLDRRYHGGVDLPSDACGMLGWTVWHLGYPDQAVAWCQRGVARAHELDSVISLAYVLQYKMWVHMFRREVEATEGVTRELDQAAAEAGVAGLLGNLALIGRGWCLAQRSPSLEGPETLRRGWEDMTSKGLMIGSTVLAVWLAEALGCCGRSEEGLKVLEDARAWADTVDELLYASETERVRGELILAGQKPDAAMAESSFRRAIEIARPQETKAYELRASTSLARLLEAQGRAEEALAVLSPTYAWFTEGFETADLQEAKALLGRLG